MTAPIKTALEKAIDELAEQRKHAKENSVARQRIKQLLDPGTLEELGTLRPGPVTGTGKVHGVVVGVVAYEPEGPGERTKIERLLALIGDRPLIWLLDGAVDGPEGRSPQLAIGFGSRSPGAEAIARASDWVIGVGADWERQVDRTAGEAEAPMVARELVGFFPEGGRPSILPSIDPPLRAKEEILRLLPDDPRQSYDMKAVLARILDDGRYLELEPHAAPSLITALARLGGRAVGVVASQPKVREGLITAEAARKAERFANRCRAFGIPLVVLWDTPGFAEGADWTIVPAVSVVVRRSAARSCAELTLAWPAAEGGTVDEVIDPRETRKALLRGLELATS